MDLSLAPPHRGAGGHMQFFIGPRVTVEWWIEDRGLIWRMSATQVERRGTLGSTDGMMDANNILREEGQVAWVLV